MSLTVLFLNQAWFAEELRRRGHTVVTAGFERPDFDLNIVDRVIEGEELLEWAEACCGSPIDRLVYFDNSSLPLITGVDRIKVPTVFYSIDAHHHHLWQSYFGALFDLTLVAQCDYAPRFLEQGAEVRWFPLWARVLEENSGPRTIPVSFRGTMDEKLHPGRREFFRRVGERVPLDAGEGDYRAVYANSQIVLNESVGGDVNFRTFEALGCGALLLAPETENGLRRLLQEGREFVTYRNGDVDDAVAKIQYYLAHEEERACIAEAGHRAACQRHSERTKGGELEAILLGLYRREKKQPDFLTAMTFLRSYQASQKVMPKGNPTFLAQAAFAFLRCTSDEVRGREEFLEGAFLASLYLEQWVEHREVLSFIRAIWQSSPGSLLLSLRYVSLLLVAQEGELAKAVAATLSDRPDELVASAPNLIADVQAQLLCK